MFLSCLSLSSKFEISVATRLKNIANSKKAKLNFLEKTCIRIIGVSSREGAVQLVRFPCQGFVHVNRPGEAVELVGGQRFLKTTQK